MVRTHRWAEVEGGIIGNAPKPSLDVFLDFFAGQLLGRKHCPLDGYARHHLVQAAHPLYQR
jgi:hypothetical protein